MSASSFPASGRTPATGAYVLSRRELSPGWVLLYAATFALQLLCAGFRGFITYPILWLAFKMLGWSTSPVHTIAFILAYGPLALSLATLLLPLGGWWWQQRTGGRTPSEREWLIYADAIAQLTQQSSRLRPPRRWFVLDRPEPNAAVYADTLMLTRGLLESAYLLPVLAHELGHLNSSDGRLTAALYRLTTPPRERVRRPFGTIALIATGAAGIWAVRLPWAAYWRAREYDADRYAATLGQAQPLAMFLDGEALEYDLPTPFPWLHEHTHPPTEHRLDRIEHLQATPTPARPSV
jgi:Zn-dependent protease with chaperone function